MLVQLVPGLLLSVANISENPTHYGKPSWVNGACKSDEKEWSVAAPECGDGDDGCAVCQYNQSTCYSESDCPQDKPPNTKGGILCDPQFGDCKIGCSNNTDCQLGAICIGLPHALSVPFCAYQRSSDCYYISNVKGSWVMISSSSGKQSVQYSEGVTRSHTVESSSTWGGSVTTTASAGFDFFGNEGSVSVSGEVSDSVAHSYSDTFSKSSTTTYTYEFDAGVVWQWKFDITDPCGAATASGHDLALTPGAFAPPCCLPGMFENITLPTGACHGTTPNICNSTAARVGA